MVQRGLGEELQRVRLLLCHRRRFRGGVRGRRVERAGPLLRVQGVACRGQRLQEERTGLGGQASTDRRGAVVIWMHVEGPAGVLSPGLVILGLAIHATPAADDALDVLRRAGAPDGEQPSLDVWCRDAGEGADLRVRQLAAGERLGEPRQRGQGARHADLLAGRAQIEADAPGEPLGTGPKAGVPATTGIEVPDQIEQACGGFYRTADRRFRSRLAPAEGRLSQRLIRLTARPLKLVKSRLSDTHASSLTARIGLTPQASRGARVGHEP